MKCLAAKRRAIATPFGAGAIWPLLANLNEMPKLRQGTLFRRRNQG
jgi:hypothetical protein